MYYYYLFNNIRYYYYLTRVQGENNNQLYGEGVLYRHRSSSRYTFCNSWEANVKIQLRMEKITYYSSWLLVTTRKKTNHSLFHLVIVNLKKKVRISHGFEPPKACYYYVCAQRHLTARPVFHFDSIPDHLSGIYARAYIHACRYTL